MAERVAQVYLPALQRATPSVQVDPDPQLASRVKALIEATASGQLKESEFEYLRAGFFPDRPEAYRKMLEGPGTLQVIGLLERFPRGDDTVVIYRARIGTQQLLVRPSVTRSGRFSSYSMQPESLQP